MEANQASSEYWAVECSCGDFIALAPVMEDEKTHEVIDFPPEPVQFEATCECGNARLYVKGEVMLC
jgi:hypothetical protein